MSLVFQGSAGSCVFTVSCDSPACVRAEQTVLPGNFEYRGEKLHSVDPERLAGQRFEVAGWFIEQFPGKTKRYFCPHCGPAYRTAFHRVQDELARFERSRAR